jgi:hypothetical protein
MEVLMLETSAYEALIEQLRAELTKAEEVFRQATTPESKGQARDRLEEARVRYSLALIGKAPHVEWQRE